MKGNLEKDSGSVSLKFSTTLSLLFYKHCLKWLSCCDRYFNRKKKTQDLTAMLSWKLALHVAIGATLPIA